MTTRPTRPWRWLLLAAAVLAADQLSKQLVVAHLRLGQALPLSPFFSLLHIDNAGAAFSFLAAAGGWQRWLFTGFGLAAAALILLLLLRSRRPLFSAALALILGGALGNVLDRVLAGRVTDFLDFYLVLAGRAWHWPAFNLADSAIFIGALLLVIDEARKG